LKNSAGWTPSKISKAMNAGEEQWVKLGAVVPVYITYFTAWVDKDGKLNFRDDIYGYDKGLPVAAASFNSNVTAGIQ
jgi:murein L,D-transpeptidase YcbB/YkuD